MGDTDKKPIVMTMPGLDNLLMMYYVVRDKVIKLLSFLQSNPFKLKRILVREKTQLRNLTIKCLCNIQILVQRKIF